MSLTHTNHENSKMNSTEKQIVKLLKDGLSQSAVANTLGVPRSLVQRVQDKEIGVDASSLKSLTTDQIVEIQKLSSGGAANSHLAEKFNVSSKTIARALMVKITEKPNNVVVISPVTGVNESEDGTPDLELQDGMTATDITGREWYVGKFLEQHDLYLAFTSTELADKTKAVEGSFFKKDDLTPLLNSVKFKTNDEVVQYMAELSAALTDKTYKLSAGLSIFVYIDDEKYPLKSVLDSRRRIGYFDAILNRTLRTNISSVLFAFQEVEAKDGEVLTESTKEELSGKSLDVFLNQHQILILPDSVVIAIDGKPRTIDTGHPSYKAIVQAIHDQDIQRAYDLMAPREALKKYSEGRVEIRDREVYWDGNKVTSSTIAKRLVALMLKGDKENLQRLSLFMDKMYQNPSASLVQSGRIYDFMAYSDIEIDSDGDIILYKSVRGNYMDKHSGTINNTPGTIVRMTRSFVNDNNKDLCSYGLHVCSLAYLKQCFGNLGQRVVRCKLNPKDIVSITDDYRSSKIRCCEYLVIDDYTSEYNRQRKSIDVEGLYR
ncbi:hypothetical protein DEEACLCL_00082 [Salmonella phage CRW-SP2]|nr:hypothetical protein DEEACLCL_00082 [Salmonella phage CRW-SP2]